MKPDKRSFLYGALSLFGPPAATSISVGRCLATLKVALLTVALLSTLTAVPLITPQPAAAASAQLVPASAPSVAAETNIALNTSRTGYPSPLESDPGWGGGALPWDMLDGATSYTDTWAHGLAFTGGTGNWMGEPCGWRQATVNFGTPKSFNRVRVWHFGTQHIPNTYLVEYWDGASWLPVGGTSVLRSDLDSATATAYGAIPTESIFPTITVSKVRFRLNNCDIEHGWIYEFEVFADNVATTGTMTGTAILAAGNLALALAGGLTFNGALTGLDQVLTASGSATVTDATGSGNGWNLTISATPFTTGGASPHPLPSTTLVIGSAAAPVTATAVPGSTATAPANTVTLPVVVPMGSAATPAKFFNAATGSGMGQFGVGIPYFLNVPAATFAGTYTSTVTLSIISGP